MDNGSGLRATIVCTGDLCEDWGWRGLEGKAPAVAQGHTAEERHQGSLGAHVLTIKDIPGEGQRERRGRIVREVWVATAEERGDTNPSHLTPWSQLNAQDRDVDERIGAALATDQRIRQASLARERALDPELRWMSWPGRDTDHVWILPRDREAGS